MKEIFDEYGPAILTAIAAGLIMILFFANIDGHDSLLTKIGAEALPDLPIMAEHYDAQSNAQAFDEFAQRGQPTAKVEGRAIAETEVSLLDELITVSDCENNVYYASSDAFYPNTGDVDTDDALGGSVKVLSIKNASGDDFIDAYDTDTDSIIFPEPGMYWIELYICDYYNVEARCMCELPVDMAPEE